MPWNRMFNTAVVNSASFLKMPLTSQALYFHLGLHADDDGIVDAYVVLRMLGSAADDLNILVIKKYVVPLDDDMLLWIVHFNINNHLRADRIKTSMHRETLLSKVPNAYLLESKNKSDNGSGPSPEFQAEIDAHKQRL